MNLSRSIFKNTAAVFLARSVTMLGSILLVFFISRAVKAEGLGSYSTALAIFGLAELACELGLSNFIPRELSKDLTQTNRYLIHTGGLVLVSATISALLLIILAPWLHYSPETVNSITIISLAIFPVAMGATLGAIFITHQRAELDTLNTLIWTTIRIAASIFLLTKGYGVLGVILAFTITSYFSLITSLFLYIKYIDKPHFEFDRQFFKATLVNIRTFIVLALAGSVFANAETVILSFIKGETEVGYFTAGLKLITVWYLIPQSFMTVVFPVLSRAYQNSAAHSKLIQEKAVKYLLAAGFPLAFGGFAAAGPIIRAFYGPGFEVSIFIFRVITWHTVLAFINNVLWRILLANNNQRLALRVQIISGFTRVGLSILFIPFFGSLGAAMALIGGYLLYTLLHLKYVRATGISLDIIRLGWRFAVAAVLMGVAVILLAQHLNIFLLILAGALVYLLSVLILRGFNREDWALLSQVWEKKTSLNPDSQETLHPVN